MNQRSKNFVVDEKKGKCDRITPFLTEKAAFPDTGNAFGNGNKTTETNHPDEQSLIWNTYAIETYRCLVPKNCSHSEAPSF